jgi:dihydrofolate reductase / thymidylate synthase
MGAKINLIYSESIDGIIGVNNDLYCKIKGDLKMFQLVTSLKYNNHENAIIMGYNTWKSIRGPLKNRINIVISRNHCEEMKAIDGVFSFESLQKMFNFLETIDYGKLFVIGGEKLFGEIILKYSELIDVIYQTQISEEVPKSHYSSRNDVSYSTIPLIKMMMSGEIQKIKSLVKSEEGQLFDFEKNDYLTKNIHYLENVYQKTENINTQEYQYLNLLEEILKEGVSKESRNSMVFSSFGSRMNFDLREGFPLLTTKKMPWKTILRELLWFIQGSTDNKLLQDKNVHIWDGNSSKEFLKSRGLDTYEEGDLGPIYGFQWRHFGAEYIDHKTDYSDQGIDQLQWIIDEIKANPTSRRLLMSAWNPIDLNKMALPPCHVMVQFNIESEYIDAQLYQRSGDMFLGVPFNIASYSFLLHIVGQLTGYIPRYLIHIIGDTHIYENHTEAVHEQLQRVPSQFPQLRIKTLENIDSIQESDFVLDNYNSFPTIKAEMIA